MPPVCCFSSINSLWDQDHSSIAVGIYTKHELEEMLFFWAIRKVKSATKWKEPFWDPKDRFLELTSDKSAIDKLRMVHIELPID